MPIQFTFGLSFLAFMGAMSSRLLLALMALSEGASPATVGMLASVLAICPLVLSLMVGGLADRHGARWLLVVGGIANGTGLLVPVYVSGVNALFAAAFLAGMGFAFKAVVLQNLVGIQSRPPERLRNFGNHSLVTATCMLLAPVCTGAMVDFAGHAAACLYVVSLEVALVGMLVVWGGGLPRGSGKAAASEGRPAPQNRRALLRSLAVSSCVQVSIDVFQFCIPIYGHDIGLPASVIGLVLGAFAAAAFVARVAMPRLIARLGEQRLLAWSLWLGAVAFLVIPLSRDAAMLMLISFAYGLGMGCGTPLAIMLMFSQSPAGRSGSALGLRLTANNTLRLVGPSLFGLIGSAFGLLPIFVLSAAVMGAGGALSRPDAPVKGP